MDTQRLLRAPENPPEITSKISNIGKLVESSTRLRKSTSRLRKIFETNSYQKKTQLSVLNRYKRRLDSINKENDRRLERLQKKRGKSIVPKIKPFIGSLFSSKGDPLKTIAQLAAFNLASKLAKNDIVGSIGPGLALASLIFGPKLLKMGAGSILKGGLKSPGIGRGYEDILKKLSKKSNPTSGEKVVLRNFDRYRKAGLGAEESAFRSLNRGSGYSIETAKDFRKLLRSETGIEARVAERAAERSAIRGAKGAAGSGFFKGFGGFAGPVLNTALTVYDFFERKSEGQTDVQAGAGAAGSLLGALAAGALAGAIYGSVVPVAGTLVGGAIGLIVSGLAAAGGSILGGGLMDMITGVNKKSSGKLGSFSNSLDNYERIINKFSSYAFGSSIPYIPGASVDGAPVAGEIQQVGQYQTNTLPGKQHYGAPRDGGRPHAGVDLQMHPNSKQITFMGGVINYIGHHNGGYYTFVDIMTATGYIERLAELGRLSPGIRVGARVSPGQVISSGLGPTGVTHLEYRRPGTSGITGTVNPIEFLKSQKVISGGNTLNYRTQQTSVPPSSTTPPTPSATPTPARTRSIPQIQEYPSYAPSSYRAPSVIPVPITPQQAKTMMVGGSSEIPMSYTSSDQDLLNSFYKRVLLNTLQ